MIDQNADANGADNPGVTNEQPKSIEPAWQKPRRYSKKELKDLLHQGSFWTSVYPLFMRRLITRADIFELVKDALVLSGGVYKMAIRHLGVTNREYKQFLNFLRKHDCQVPYRLIRYPPKREDVADLAVTSSPPALPAIVVTTFESEESDKPSAIS